MTRASIFIAFTMDCRVKPGNDKEGKWNSNATHDLTANIRLSRNSMSLTKHSSAKPQQPTASAGGPELNRTAVEQVRG